MEKRCHLLQFLGLVGGGERHINMYICIYIYVYIYILVITLKLLIIVYGIALFASKQSVSKVSRITWLLLNESRTQWIPVQVLSAQLRLAYLYK